MGERKGFCEWNFPLFDFGDMPGAGGQRVGPAVLPHFVRWSEGMQPGGWVPVGELPSTCTLLFIRTFGGQ